MFKISRHYLVNDENKITKESVAKSTKSENVDETAKEGGIKNKTILVIPPFVVHVMQFVSFRL